MNESRLRRSLRMFCNWAGHFALGRGETTSTSKYGRAFESPDAVGIWRSPPPEDSSSVSHSPESERYARVISEEEMRCTRRAAPIESPPLMRSFSAASSRLPGKAWKSSNETSSLSAALTAERALASEPVRAFAAHTCVAR